MKMMIVWLLGLGVATVAHGHHSMTWHFDRNVEVTIEGVIKEFRFINPHGRLLVDVTDEKGRTETWDCELNSAAAAVRNGWTDELFQPGGKITVTGFAARRHERECYYELGILADGTRIARNERLAADTGVASPAPRNHLVPGSVPDFSRIWEGEVRGSGPPEPGDENPYAWILSEAGRRALEAYDPVTDDPSLQCKPVSIRRLWSNGSPTEIRQEADKVTIRHEWMDAKRTVHLGQREHPPNAAESPLGHSIGWYEGNTLVIDTVGYEAGVFFQFPGLPHSNQLHTVERLTLGEDGQSFAVSWTAEDPEYFIDKLSGSHHWKASDAPVRQYNCTHPELGK